MNAYPDGAQHFMIALRILLRDGSCMDAKMKHELVGFLKTNAVNDLEGTTASPLGEWLLGHDIVLYMLGVTNTLSNLELYRNDGYWVADYALLLNGDTNSLVSVADMILSKGLALYGPSDAIVKVVPIWIARINERLQKMAYEPQNEGLRDKIEIIVNYHAKLMNERRKFPLKCDDSDMIREIDLALKTSNLPKPVQDSSVR